MYLKWICYSYIITKRVCSSKQLHSFVENVFLDHDHYKRLDIQL